MTRLGEMGTVASLNPCHHRREGHSRDPGGIGRDPVRRCLGIITLLFFLGIPATGLAQDAGVPWSNLNPEEQQVLRRYSDRWDTLSPNQQERLQRGAREWIHMDPQQRERIRTRYERFRQLPPAEQERLRRTHRWYRNLPPDQRENLKRRWQNSPSRQHPRRR